MNGVENMNPIDIMEDILRFRGFWKSPFKDKIKWIFILYPFFLGVLLFHLILWIPLLPSIIKSMFKRK
jgi:hypothetical protein